jgi:hypothetical protein
MSPWQPSWISDFHEIPSQLSSHIYKPLWQLSKESVNICHLWSENEQVYLWGGETIMVPPMCIRTGDTII